jgi:hypothetical protein
MRENASRTRGRLLDGELETTGPLDSNDISDKLKKAEAKGHFPFMAAAAKVHRSAANKKNQQAEL